MLKQAKCSKCIKDSKNLTGGEPVCKFATKEENNNPYIKLIEYEDGYVCDNYHEWVNGNYSNKIITILMTGFRIRDMNGNIEIGSLIKYLELYVNDENDRRNYLELILSVAIEYDSKDDIKKNEDEESDIKEESQEGDEWQ